MHSFLFLADILARLTHTETDNIIQLFNAIITAQQTPHLTVPTTNLAVVRNVDVVPMARSAF